MSRIGNTGDRRSGSVRRRRLAALGVGLAGLLMVQPALIQAQSAGAAVGRWQPQVGETFYIQYTGTIDMTRPAQVYNLDWETTTAAQVRQLKSRGVHVVCYLSAGSSETWRSDNAKIPASVKGEPLDGWDGENWLDVRQTSVLVPIMAARMDVCKQKGFDAIDPDNTDGWSQQTGFPITKAHQVTYQRALADAAHARGLAVGLKNNVEQLSQMAGFVDFAVNEECNEYGECGAYKAFLAAGKPVYNIEYRSTCPTNLPAGMSSFISNYDLGRGGTICGAPAKPAASTPTSAPASAPAVEAPATKTPVAVAPETETPTEDVVETPVVDEPIVETPKVEAPKAETVTEDEPQVPAPVVQSPVVQAPVVQAPVVKAPVVQAPVVQAPVVQQPTVAPTVPAKQIQTRVEPVAERTDSAEPVASREDGRDRWSTWSRYDWWRHDRSRHDHGRYSFR